METIKQSMVQMYPLSAIESGKKFNINLGNSEVIELKSLYYCAVGALAVGLNQITFGLYRKSDILSMSGIMENEADIIWSTRLATKFVVDSLECGWTEMIHFPSPLILIRPPSIIAQESVVSVYTLLVRIYYLIRRVSKVEMAKLMIKDHE